VIINLVSDPDHIWFTWLVLGWGVGVIIHGLPVFNEVDLFSPDWEKQQIEKRLGRKLSNSYCLY
jgi:hypothetical protein